MPAAQGRITVRRRAADGAPGADAVTYTFIPSASSVAVGNDGTLRPASLSARLVRHSAQDTDITAQSFDGMKVTGHFVIGSARTTFNYTPGANLTTAAALSAVEFVLSKDGVTVAFLSVPVVKDGADGKDGKDSERCWLVPTATAVKKAADGTFTPSAVSVKVMRQKGESATEEATGMFVRYKLTQAIATLKWSKYTPDTAIDIMPLAKSVDFELYRHGATEVGTGAAVGIGVCLDTLTIPVVADGEKGDKGDRGEQGDTGDQGIQGCIYRRTLFAQGVEYRNDTNLRITGLRYIDLVYITRDGSTSASQALWFQCRKTHTSSASNAPQPTSDGTEPWLEYWGPLSAMKPLYTPLLLADNAIIKLLQSNQIVVMKQDGSTVSAAMGGGRYPLWAGGENAQNGIFCIDDTGRLVSGKPDGQRVEIQPGARAMKIYDTSGVETASYEGNAYTSPTALFSGTSGSFTMTGLRKGSVSLPTGTTSLTETYTATGALHTDALIEAVVSGRLQTHVTRSYTGGITVPDVESGAATGPGTVTDGSNISVNHSTAAISLYLNTYSDSALTVRTGSVLIATCRGESTVDISGKRVKTMTGGYHAIVAEVSLSAVGSSQTAWARWGSTAEGADLSATYTGDFYVSRYFANGFCLGRSATDYIMAYNQSSGGMRLVAENSGYGLDISDAGIRTRHHGGSWTSMPLFVFRGRAYHNSTDNKYSWTPNTIKSYNGSTPTLTRTAAGTVRLAFPAAWTNAGIAPSDCLINVIGYGTATGKSTPVKAQIQTIDATTVTVTLSDDYTPDDGAFIIQIFTAP